MNTNPFLQPIRSRNHQSPARFTDVTAIRRRIRMGIMGMSMLALAACGKSGPDVGLQFAADLPDMWQVESFKIEAEEDVGSEVLPHRRYRFRAEVAPKFDLYERLGVLDGRAILKLRVAKGDEAPVSGTANSVFRADIWKSVFAIERAPNFLAGKPADAFGAQYVVIGSSDYKNLIATAKVELVKHAEQTAADETQWRTMDVEWKTLDQKVEEDNRQLSEGLNREQQRIWEAQTMLRNQARQESQVLENEVQAMRKEKVAAPREALSKQIEALDVDYRLKVAELQAQGKEQRQSLSEKQKEIRVAYSADISAARKRLSAADLVRYRASAEEALRTQLAELDAGYRERQAKLREQETSLSTKRREQTTQANTVYQGKFASIREEVDALQNNRNDAISLKAKEAIDALSVELKNKREEYQNAVKTNHGKVAAKRQKVKQFAARVEQSRREGALREELIIQLEGGKN